MTRTVTRTALLAGATGLVGKALLEKLLEDPAYSKVKVISRRELPRRSPKLEVVVNDFSKLDKAGAALTADDVFCCLGTTLRKAGSKAAFERVDYHMVVDLARAARKAGATRFFVVSAVGSSLRSPSFYSRVKARMEKAVAEIPFEAVHVLQPSLLLGAREEMRPAEKAGQLLAPLLSPLLRGRLRKYRPIRGEAVAAALLTLAAGKEKGTHVHSLPLS